MALDLLPLAILALAATVHPLRVPLLLLLIAGFGIARARDRRRAAAWAATIPVAVSLTWGLVALPASATDGSSCADPLATLASWRLAEAFLALGTLAVLMPLVGGSTREIGLRRPSRRVGLLASLAFLVCGPLGMILGPVLAEPFFGPVELATGDPVAMVPALVFAVSNGVMEEVIYRGSLQAWTARTTGPWPAIAGQAIVFGLAHGGAGFVGSPLPVIAAMAGGGLIAGWIVWRTGSLALPIAAHVGFDIPLYYGNACRLR
jgi:membrane protease YdiL (CAAX protease family)